MLEFEPFEDECSPANVKNYLQNLGILAEPGHEKAPCVLGNFFWRRGWLRFIFLIYYHSGLRVDPLVEILCWGGEGPQKKGKFY